MTNYLLPALLQALGFLVVVAEVFIPSMGLLSILAAGLIFYSLYLTYTGISSQAFWGLVGMDLLVLPLVLMVGFKLLARSPLSLKKELSSRDGVVSHSPELAELLHETGKTITTLRPSGTALIRGMRLDVVADGEFIEAGVPIQVVRVAGNQMIVSRTDSQYKEDLK